ncbi:MAG: twin-arginine translocase subunit TatC [Pseudomonadota bacterium]
MTDKHIEESSAPLIEHLVELRGRLMWSIGALVVAILASFPFAEAIFDFLSHPVCAAIEERGRECKIVVTSAHKIFFTYVSVSIFSGFCLAFPVIAIQIWRFIAPGLYTSEQNAFLPFLLATPALFVLGASFAYYGAMPLAMDFFLSFENQTLDEASGPGLEVLQTADEYLSLTMKFILAFGICFQLPVALTLMGKAGLVESTGLKNFRKYAVVCILVVSAIVTPPDVMTQLLLFTVVYSLYEISIWLVKMVEKKRAERDAELEAELDEI